jgi:hypothetical protein
MTSHVTICWELGGGFGHIANLLPVALGLRERGFHVDFVVSDCGNAGKVLQPHGFRFYPAPIWRYGRGQAIDVSYIDILLKAGFDNASILAGQVQGWRAMFELLKTDLVVSEYAPTAVLAARTMGLAQVALGTGFFIPPLTHPMPPFRTWEKIDPKLNTPHDALVLHQINAVLQQFACAPIVQVSDLYAQIDRFLVCFPELDQYGARASETYVGPAVGLNVGLSGESTRAASSERVSFIEPRPTANTRRIFAYLKPHYEHLLDVLRGLAASGCDVICAIPEATQQQIKQLATPGLMLTNALVDSRHAIDNCDIVLCHAGLATISESLVRGKPLLLLPTNAEQFAAALRAHALAAAEIFSPAAGTRDFAVLLNTLKSQPSYATAAVAFQSKHRHFDSMAATQVIVDRCMSLLNNDRSPA